MARSNTLVIIAIFCLILFSLTITASARSSSSFFRRPSLQTLFHNLFEPSSQQPSTSRNTRSHRLLHHPDAAEHRRTLLDEHQQHLNAIKQDHDRHTRRMNQLHQQFQPQILEYPLDQLFDEPEKLHAATSELLRTTTQLLKTIFDVELDQPKSSSSSSSSSTNTDQSSTQQQVDQQQQQQQQVDQQQQEQDQQQDQQVEQQQHQQSTSSTQDLAEPIDEQQLLHTFEPTVAPEFKWFSSDKRLLLALYMPGAADLDVSVDEDILSVSARRPIATSVFSTLDSIDNDDQVVEQESIESTTIVESSSVQEQQQEQQQPQPVEEEEQEEEIFKPLSLAFNVKYHAAFRIPRTVDSNAISAVSHNGVVFLSLPLKTNQSKVRVNVKAL